MCRKCFISFGVNSYVFVFHLYPFINCRKTTNDLGTFRQLKDSRHQRRETSPSLFETFCKFSLISNDVFLKTYSITTNSYAKRFILPLIFFRCVLNLRIILRQTRSPQHLKRFQLLRRFPVFEDGWVTQDPIQKDVPSYAVTDVSHFLIYVTKDTTHYNGRRIIRGYDF